MPIVIRYDSPALVAAGAAGVGNYRAADQNFDRSQNANADAVRQSLALTAQQRQGDAQNQQALNQQDAIRLDQYGQQVQQFNTDRQFNAVQDARAQNLQMDEGQRRQAIQQVMQMAGAGQLDEATAQRWIGIAQQGGNPFQERSTTETLNQEQRQLEARAGLQQQQADLTQQNALERLGVQGQQQVARQEVSNAGALERTKVTQEGIASRAAAAANSPSQQRLAANDVYTRKAKAAGVGVEIAKQELAQLDKDIADLSADSNVFRANDAAKQGELDKLHERRKEVREELANATRSLKTIVEEAPAAGAGGATTQPSAATPAGKSAIVDVADDATYAALPSGTQYRHPDGSIRMKP